MTPIYSPVLSYFATAEYKLKKRKEPVAVAALKVNVRNWLAIHRAAQD